ncbi:hypothetical protein OIU77_026185 [Salix suchowensis]|uniref:Uncharacterized protein n=1 Tax=Salix suchowensis TaxID=1278906 RepID=A0ABQ9C2Z9_9ROSI|nr:hypothetical protein OIU77_026185 [Salix suchowensis]
MITPPEIGERSPEASETTSCFTSSGLELITFARKATDVAIVGPIVTKSEPLSHMLLHLGSKNGAVNLCFLVAAKEPVHVGPRA